MQRNAEPVKAFTENHGPRHSHSHLPQRESFPFWRLFFEARIILSHPESLRITLLFSLNLLSIIILEYLASSTNSLALTAFSYISRFHLLNLLTCYLSLWIQIQGKRPNRMSRYQSRAKVKHEIEDNDLDALTLGHGRYEVLAVFAATVLSQLSAMFVLKESVERMLDPPNVHSGRLMLGACLGFFVQIFTTNLCPGTALAHVMEVSQSSWLQEHAADLSHSLCHVFPLLSSLLLPRINPINLLSATAFSLTFLMDVILEINNTHSADCIVSCILGFIILSTFYPLSLYTGRILLQSAPSHVVPQLDRCLREALTIDGVLEFKNENFWTVSFGKLAGSLTVRIRQDADEQLVLAHLTNRLSNLVWPLTIQISRDDRSTSRLQQTSFQLIGAERIKASPLLTHQRTGLSGNCSHAGSPGMSPVGVGMGQGRSAVTTPHQSPFVNGGQTPHMGIKTSTPKMGPDGQVTPDLLNHHKTG